MAPQPCAVPLSARAALPGSDYADAFALIIPGELSAGDVARSMVNRKWGWIEALLGLRNLIVAPLGLKAGKRDLAAGVVKIGIFPVIFSCEDRIVMGLDDRHLDFRLIVEVKRQAHRQTLAVVTTLIRRHNLLGRIYLGFVLPFHRFIVPAMLARAEKAA
jgi:hypothetical protein